MRVAPIKSWHVLAVGLFGAIAIGAQAPPASVRLTATTQNVSGAGEAIKINISNWSTDMQKDELIAAWNSRRSWRRTRWAWRARCPGGRCGSRCTGT